MAEQTQQQIIIHTQYIKDFSFENPNAPGSLARNDKAPEIEIGVNVNAQPQQQQRVFEVVLTITATAKREDQHVFSPNWPMGLLFLSQRMLRKTSSIRSS